MRSASPQVGVKPNRRVAREGYRSKGLPRTSSVCSRYIVDLAGCEAASLGCTRASLHCIRKRRAHSLENENLPAFLVHKKYREPGILDTILRLIEEAIDVLNIDRTISTLPHAGPVLNCASSLYSIPTAHKQSKVWSGTCSRAPQGARIWKPLLAGGTHSSQLLQFALDSFHTPLGFLQQFNHPLHGLIPPLVKGNHSIN